jgi:hypothetical protein
MPKRFPKTKLADYTGTEHLWGGSELSEMCVALPVVDIFPERWHAVMIVARNIYKHCRTDTENAMAKARGLMQTLLATMTENISNSNDSLGNFIPPFTSIVKSIYVQTT